MILVLVSFLPVAIGGIYEYHRDKEALENQIISDLILISETKAAHIYYFINMSKERVEDFGSDVFIRSSLEKIVTHNFKSNEVIKELNLYLINNKLPLDNSIIGIIVISRDGKIVASTSETELGRDESKDDYFREGLKGIYVSDAFFSRHIKAIPAIVASAPLTSTTTEETIGVISNFISIDELNSILSSGIPARLTLPDVPPDRKKPLRVYLVNGSGILIAGSNLERGAPLETPVTSGPFNKCGTKRVTSGIYKNYLDETVLGASVCLYDLGWKLVAEINKEEAFTPVYVLRNRLIVFCTFLIVLIVGISWILSERIVTPIEELASAADKVANGDFNVRVSISGPTEIGKLAAIFNDMVEDLRSLYEELEDKVKERTLKLKAANKQLEDYSRNLEEKVKQRTQELEESRDALLNLVEDLEESRKELEKTHRNLELAHEELKEIDKIKSYIISNVSHELRTPLTIAKSAIDLAMEEEDPEARNELLKKAVKALARQNDVIEDLITISRIQKKEIKLDLKITNLVDIIKRCIKDKEELASKKNVKITLEYKEIPYINADEKYLRHAILDLLDNAIKFNRDGGKVWIKVERKNSEVEVIIKDTGIGIPVDKLEEIFKPLTQLDPSTTRKYGGTGMGLTITKRIIELHGGTIKVKSKIGQGSEFSFSLKAAD